jgi:hypothetical protein
MRKTILDLRQELHDVRHEAVTRGPAEDSVLWDMTLAQQHAVISWETES